MVTIREIIVVFQCNCGISEQFEKHFIGHRSLLRFSDQLLGFCDGLFDRFILGFDLCHVALEMRGKCIVIFHEQVFDALHRLLVFRLGTVEAFETRFELFTMLAALNFHGAAETVVVGACGKKMFFKEVKNKVHNHAGTDALFWTLTAFCFATVVVDAGRTFSFVDLGCDTRGHSALAIRTGNHAPKEIGSRALSFFHRLDHLEGRANVGELIDLEKGIDRYSGLKVIGIGEVYDNVPKHQNARIDGVAEHVRDFVDRHAIREAHFSLGRSAGIAGLVKILGHFFLCLAFGTKFKGVFDHDPILPIRTEEIVRVFVVTVLGGVNVLTLLKRSTLPTLHDFAQVVAVLLGEDKCDAKEHFTHRRIFKGEGGKRKVLDDLLVEEVDDAPCVRHIASQTVWVPREDGFVLTALDVLDHGFELEADVRLFGALLFLDDRNVTFRDTKTFGGIETVELLVRNGAFLPFVRSR